ncbi:hypothetical protein ESY86_09590 [Subsaximicrobium wynnwilliamsii]|uniref:Uncharacterized protein n=1 Tax=Subsaximicrobium wynnwilliamsii TaxID=291179 RepID=A0A5C6ZGN8_9FLAO|nr:hypothetical protein [Subsaximicrobium wynnwilliamsii]TXD83442.1 hypothetical protein ESY87_09220 [Subsaximicrobium wynnwilliamsii]TXD89283.1 hypothetical protein ESY86_09590 [Subsaximicrobium wynnwilliamsii]TXE03122.1 hypothetical protein ESY88_08930 [Subsaximicrobium wynnwilliamsii]
MNSPSDYAEGDVGTFSNDFYDFCNLDFSNISNAKYEAYSEFVWETANGNQHADNQPDLFQFSFFGHTGRFIILNINGALQPKIISSDQKVINIKRLIYVYKLKYPLFFEKQFSLLQIYYL